MILSVTIGMEDTTTPRWIRFLFGLMFFNAGITVGMMDSGFNNYRENKWLSYLHAISLLSIPLIFLALSNWVTFGPGERGVIMNLSIPFMSVYFDLTREITGRIVFGIPALLMDAFLVYLIHGLIVDFLRKKDDNLDSNTEQDNLGCKTLPHEKRARLSSRSFRIRIKTGLFACYHIFKHLHRQ